MLNRQKIVKSLSFILLFSIFLSGCIESKVPDSVKAGFKNEAKMKDNETIAFITSKSSNSKKMVLKFASIDRDMESSPSDRGFMEFLKVLKEELGDKIEVRLFFGGVLGTSTDAVLGGIQNEAFELTHWPLGSFAEYTKTFTPLDVPYLFLSYDQAYNLLEGDVGEIMRQKCIKETNIMPLFYAPIGMRHITNSKREIKSPDDLKGLKIRVQNNNFHIQGLKALGAEPTPIAYSELFTALQQGVVDGQENPIVNIYETKLYEVQKYMTLTSHLYTAQAMVINYEFYKKLPQDFKDAIKKASIAGSKTSYEMVKQSEKGKLEELAKSMKIYVPTENELKKFQDKIKPIFGNLSEQIGKNYFKQIIDKAGIKVEN